MKQISLLLLLCLPLCLMAANKKVTISKVSEPVTLTEDVDYNITSTTPFDEEGLVNIQNTEHAVVILTLVRPSEAISKWLSKIQIDGVKASNNNNCQVKLYNRGCIIMPYSRNYKPLTVFSEQNFEGESCDEFGTENANGYMNTLTTKKLKRPAPQTPPPIAIRSGSSRFTSDAK